MKTTDGPFRIYTWYYEDVQTSKNRVQVNTQNPSQTHIDLSFFENNLKDHQYGITPQGQFVDLNSFGFITHFQKKMSDLLADDTALARKIKNKETGYDYANLEKIIKEYNVWYAKNHPTVRH